MRTTRGLYFGLVAVSIAVLLIATPARLRAHETTTAAVSFGDHDLGGVVTSAHGPEAGVWVIAETTDLSTKFVKIVVTDEQGRYMLPDLPQANYSVWVRGYGLVDSPKVQVTPGKILHLQAVVAPQAAAAAEYYPAIYWYAMLKVPDKGEFPGTGPNGNGIPTHLKSQAQWLHVVKAYLHDEIATDKRHPTVNANGLIYGAPEESTDFIPVLDPVAHKAGQIKMPVRDPQTPSSKANAMTPSPYWGDEVIWDSQTSMHNPMFDEQGRVWFTSRVRPPDNPAFCKKGSAHPSAQLFPLEQSNRHLAMYDPKTSQFTLISTCFPTHHLQFAEDANQTLWTSAGGPASG